MKRLETADIFLGVSGSGGVAVIGLALLMLFMANLSYVGGTGGLLYEALFGPNSPTELIETSRNTFDSIGQTVLGNAVLNKVMFFAFWMMVGLIVYVLLTTIGQTVGEANDEIEARKYVHARREFIERNFLLRMALRFAAGLGLALSVWIVVQLLFPFAVLASRAWLTGMSTPINWLYGFLGLSVLSLSLHVMVILLRLLCLRPRLFGGWESFV